MQIYQMRQTSVLAVDGSGEALRKLRQILSSRVTFTGLSTGGELLAYLGWNAVDLVLLSTTLPDSDGFELLRCIREDEKLQSIPVIMMTTDQSQKAEAAITMAGAFDIIRKPFVPIIVVKKVEQVLELEYLHRHLRSEVRRQTKLAEERLFGQMVMALSETIDAKDAYTRGHSRRVARYARMISARIGWQNEEKVKIYQMGLCMILARSACRRRLSISRIALRRRSMRRFANIR